MSLPVSLNCLKNPSFKSHIMSRMRDTAEITMTIAETNFLGGLSRWMRLVKFALVVLHRSLNFGWFEFLVGWTMFKVSPTVFPPLSSGASHQFP